jgi:hypothetical protein
MLACVCFDVVSMLTRQVHDFVDLQHVIQVVLQLLHLAYWQ